MKLHEYQAKELLKKEGVFTLPSKLCYNLEDTKKAIEALGFPLVIKAQVHAGGRGKAGGIKVATNLDDALKFAKDILSLTIKTAQTKANGQKVSSILIEKAASIKKELYLSMLIDRETKKICLLASKEGGMEIEEIAKKDPDSIKKIFIDLSTGLMPFQIRQLAGLMSIQFSLLPKFQTMLLSIYKAFIEYDASMIEINPLVVSHDDLLVALDAKMIIDDNALYRQATVSKMQDVTQDDEKEIEAMKHNLSYVSLDGNIGCMVNGAGLAMATMDIIKYVGGKPANFLDVGGSATKERVEEALRIIISDPNVKAIFINVFGGIAKCDVIALGVVSASKSLGLNLPLVVRLQGTNVEKGQSILKNSGLKIISADSMLDGAKKAVEMANAHTC